MSQPGTSNAQDDSWEPPLYIHSDSDTLRIQGEIYHNDTQPILCIGLEDDQMTDYERQLVLGNRFDQAHIRKCIYMVNTLSPDEEIAYQGMDPPEEQSAYLRTLIDEVERGTRPMRVFHPRQEPAQDAHVEPELTPLEQKAKWLKNNQRLVLQVTPRAPGEVPPRKTRQTPARPATPSPAGRETAQLNQTIQELRAQLGQALAANADRTLPDASGIQPYNPGLNKTTGRQGLNLTRELWTTDTGATILPLGNEIPEVYQGSNALSESLLTRLQVQPVQHRVENYKRLPYKEGDNMLTTFDMWAIAVHRSFPDNLAKKDALWTEISGCAEMLNLIPEAEEYWSNADYSFIRLVYECRSRLSQDARKEDIAQKYLVAKQKPEEKAIEYVKRLHCMRERAFGYQSHTGKRLYENAWINHLEVAMNGFLNKQVALAVSNVYPETADQLAEVVRKTEQSLTRMLRVGYAQGTVDPSATLGLEKPPQRVASMAENIAPCPNQTIQALNRDKSRYPKCMNCGDRYHSTEVCTSERVCWYCKKPGHMARECFSRAQDGNNKPRGTSKHNSKPAGAPAKTYQVQAMGVVAAEALAPQATWAGFQEGSL